MDLSKLHDAIIRGNARESEALTKEAIAAGLDPMSVVNGTLIPAMEVVGALFQRNEYYIPEMLISARAMKTSLALLKPLIAASGQAGSATRVVIGTVQGDLHDIGKNLVGMMLEGAGYEIVDLGTDVTAEQFVNGVREHGAKVVCLSALLTTTMTGMKGIIESLQSAGLRDKVYVMIGGAPVTDRFAKQIGADGYAADAASAADLLKGRVLSSATS